MSNKIMFRPEDRVASYYHGRIISIGYLEAIDKENNVVWYNTNAYNATTGCAISKSLNREIYLKHVTDKSERLFYERKLGQSRIKYLNNVKWEELPLDTLDKVIELTKLTNKDKS